MEDRKEPIGDLFQKAFKDAEWSDPSDEQDWNEISFQLDQKRFYRFSWTRFNIYYSSLIFISLILMIFLVVKSIFLSDPSEQNQSIVPAIADSLAPRQTSNTNSYEQNNSTRKQNYPGQKQINPGNDNQSETSTSIAPDTSENKGSNATIIATDTATTQEKLPPVVIQDAPAIKKPKKIVYITKQDTITVVDTLRSRRLRNRQK